MREDVGLKGRGNGGKAMKWWQRQWRREKRLCGAAWRVLHLKVQQLCYRHRLKETTRSGYYSPLKVDRHSRQHADLEEHEPQ